MLVFGIIMVIVAGVGFGGLLFFMRWLKKKSPALQLQQEERSDGESPVQTFFGIEGVDRGVLVLTGGRYRVFIEAPSLNVPLMADEEQATLESRFASMLARINFPIQFYMQNRPLDMGEIMEELEGQYDDAPENLKEYAEVLKSYLYNLSAETPIWVRRKVIVVPFDDPDATFEDAIKVLDQRARLILSELEACGIEGRCLPTDDIVHLFYTHLNKGRSIAQPFRNVVEAGHTYAYVRGDSVNAVLQ